MVNTEILFLKIGFVFIYMSENKNGDAWLSDTNADIVVVLDKREIFDMMVN